ncbi:MAG: hypothetical protein HF311_08550 [Ignavibacteria bacterium]|jgi:C-terminal processing protease CtpA/Prc|nr:hypothetical protein [Ignavibacteria bacterium]
MPGARIVAINGLEADSLFNAFKTYRGGESEKWQNNVASEWFKRYLWLNKILAPYEITFRANGREMKLKTDGIARSRTPSQPAVTYKEPYTFEMLPGNIGYMNYLSMESNDVSNPFGAFLEKVFSELKAKEASGLIIDLRQNGGGNAKYGYMLLNYLAEKPFRMHSMKAWKASAQYKDYMRSRIPWWLSWVSYRPAIWIAGLFSEYADMFTAKDGEVLKFYTAEEIPEDNPLRFQIKVCFLIGTGTYSSAMLLANAVSDYKLACLIGEETGGIPNEFGEVYYFRLPNTQLMVSMPSALFVRANGNCSDRRGVLPDIEVKRKPMDTERQSDTVLEAARNWILNN